LGTSHEEAVLALQTVTDHITLLVCDGYNIFLKDDNTTANERAGIPSTKVSKLFIVKASIFFSI